jgi:hypothetical protein
MKKLGIQLMVLLVGVLYVVSSASVGYAQQQDFDKVQIQTIPLRDGVAMLIGNGGNLGVSFGEDGVFLIDDQFALIQEGKTQEEVVAAKPTADLDETWGKGFFPQNSLWELSILICLMSRFRASACLLTAEVLTLASA